MQEEEAPQLHRIGAAVIRRGRQGRSSKVSVSEEHLTGDEPEPGSLEEARR